MCYNRNLTERKSEIALSTLSNLDYLKGIKMKSEKKENLIGMLDKAINYGEDLKSQIESDSEKGLDSLKSEYKVWVSDNKNRLEQVIPNYNSYKPLFMSVDNISRSEILGDSEDETAYIKYENAKRDLISGVEYELSRLLLIRKGVLNGTIVPNIDSE